MKRMGVLLLLFFTYQLAGVEPGMSLDLSRSGQQYFPFLEWSLSNPSYSGNPFDLIASATFIHDETSETHTTQMFYDGSPGDTWKFRFSATQPGSWTVTTSSADPQLDGHSGTLSISINSNLGAHGFMKKFGDKWGWAGTETALAPQYVMVGDNGGSSPADYDSVVEVNELITEFMVGHGFSGFHIAVVGGRWFDKEKSSNAVNPSLTDPDPAIFEALETLITTTHEAGGSVHLWAWGDSSRGQTPRQLVGGINGEVDRRLQRYIAARLGPLPGWSMGYGFDLDEWVNEAQLKTWRNLMHTHLGWSHFLGGRHHAPNSGTDHSSTVSWNSGMDYNAYEHHRPTYEILVAAMESAPEQPVFSEDRFRIRDEGRAKDYDPTLTRRGLWHAYMSGGVAGIWGNLLSGESDPYPNKEQLKTNSVFFIEKNRFLPDMIRDNSITDGSCLRTPSQAHFVFYREDAASVNIDLRSMLGEQPGVAVDTLKPYSEISLGLFSPGNHTWTAPYESDWAIAIGYFNTGAPVDSDSDGLSDILEGRGCTDPLDADSDDDGLKDGEEDKNRNGNRNGAETDPCNPDSDGDGLQDGMELGVTSADLGADTDLLFFTPDRDPRSTTHPLLGDTDLDGLGDGVEDANQNGRLDQGETDPRRKNDINGGYLIHPALKAAVMVAAQKGAGEGGASE